MGQMNVDQLYKELAVKFDEISRRTGLTVIEIMDIFIKALKIYDEEIEKGKPEESCEEAAMSYVKQFCVRKSDIPTHIPNTEKDNKINENHEGI